MGKIGLGSRPSDIKKRRDKHIDFEDANMVEGPFVDSKKPIKHKEKKVKKSSGMLLKTIFIAICALIVGVLVSYFLFFDFSFDLALDQAVFFTGEREIDVKGGESFDVKFSDGLLLKNVAFKGIYSLFQPDGITVEVDDVPGTDNMYNVDLLPLLKPEEKTSYKILISKDNRNLGKISFEIKMDARDWIKRADTVEDKKIQKECYKKAIASDPDSEEAHIALGRLYDSEGKLKSAISEYESALRINPESMLTLKSLLSLYIKGNDRSKLIQTYESLAQHDDKEADKYYYEAGVIAEKQGSNDKAMSLYRDALSKNRAHINARERLIKLYGKNKEWNRAAGNTRVLLEYDPKNPELYLYLSDVLLNMNDVKGAVSSVRQAEKLKPGDLSISLQLATIYEKAEQYDEAIESYKKVVKLNKKNSIAFNNLGVLQEKKGNRKEAIKNYEKAVSLEPRNTGYSINLADAYEKNNQLDNAVKVYNKITELDKKNKDAWEALAVLCYKTKKNWKALQAYIELSKLEPKKVLWHEKTALLYEDLGKIDRARDEYKKILEIDPKNSGAKKKYLDLSKQKVKKKLH
jgi:tetratricopeptide (TPR) repeat protein